MRTFIQDLRFGFRLLKSKPGFTSVAVLTLALGIAATTTVASWIDGLLLRPFPGSSNSHQLAVMEMITDGAPNGANQVSYPDYKDYRNSLKSLAGIALHREDVFSLGEAVNARPVWGEVVSGNYFDLLGLDPMLGRRFSVEEQDEKLGAHPVVIISARLWQSWFKSDPAVVGKTLRVNRRQLTVVGVTPAEFNGTMPGLSFDMWVPLTMGPDLGIVDASVFQNRGNHGLYAIARLRPGVSIDEARAEAGVASRRLAVAYPATNRFVHATVLPPWRFHSGAPELLFEPLRILMAVSIVVLLIVCANVANLLLVRSVARQKEYGVRLAMGASRARLVRQSLTETMLLSVCAAFASVPLALWMSESLPGMVPSVGVVMISTGHLNGMILLLTIITCSLAALISGMAPALFAVRADLSVALNEGGRSNGSSAQSHRVRGLLVIAEVALAAVALIGAGLFLRSFQNARNINPGFDRTNLLLSRFFMAGTGFSADQLDQFCVRLQRRLQTNPGITGVAYADFVPLGTSAGPYRGVEVEGYVAKPGESMDVSRALISSGYFNTMRIPLLDGRDFRESDDKSAPAVMIVNEAFSRRFFRGENPVGHKIRMRGKWATVIGLAKDSKYFNAAESSKPFFYSPIRQSGIGSSGLQIYFLIKTGDEAAPIYAAMRREVAAIDPNAGAFHAMPYTAWSEVTLLPQKIAANFLAALGIISLLLSGVGLYSVMSYAVSQRTQEMGIRMALGAMPGDIVKMVLMKSMALAGAGLLAGALLAIFAARMVGSMLIHVTASDPATFAAALGFLAVVSLLAGYLPARKATRVDPMTAFRCE